MNASWYLCFTQDPGCPPSFCLVHVKLLFRSLFSFACWFSGPPYPSRRKRWRQVDNFRRKDGRNYSIQIKFCTIFHNRQLPDTGEMPGFDPICSWSFISQNQISTWFCMLPCPCFTPCIFHSKELNNAFPPRLHLGHPSVPVTNQLTT